MSKTVDELVRVFEIAHYGAANGPADKTRLRAGIAAVIRALRDEVLQSPSLEDEGMVTVVDDIFDQILGSDAGEKVAGKNEGYSHAEPSPATDPAPAVCVWTRAPYTALYSSCCDEDYLHNVTDSGMCHRCGKPIKFTEAQR